MTRLFDFARSFGAAALSSAMLLGLIALQTANANQRGDGVVAFAYDAGTEAFLKAFPRALYRSSDEGKSWQTLAISVPEDGEITGVAASPAGKGVTYVAGRGMGVLRSDDAGKTWDERNEGLPSRDVTAVAAHTTQSDTVYAVVSDHGVYRSQDAGKSWRLMDRASQGGIRQLIHSNLAGSMQTGWLFAATPKGVRRSMDCFCLWQDAGNLGTEAYSVSYDPRQPDNVYVATEKGLFRSTDGGENWIQVASPSSKAVAIAFSRSGALYAVNDEGALFLSRDQGNSWNQVNA